jgi:Ca2+-binding RTX toxin-like protein
VAVKNAVTGSGTGSFTIDNEAGATIAAANKDGIHVDKFTSGVVTINNDGTIQSTGTSPDSANDHNGQAIDFDGITAATASSVINNHGLIQAADADAIRPGSNATINNYGTIRSLNGSPASTGNDAIDFQKAHTGDVVNNFAGGLIDGARHGITGDTAITVINSGHIIGEAGSGINMDTTAGVTTITNLAGGEITGNATGGIDADGIDVDYLVSIDNFGTIKAAGLTTVAGSLNEALAIGGGTIHNEVGGLIVSDQRAITVDDSNNGDAFGATTITNEGTIWGKNGEAILLNSTHADSITNSGTITGSIAMGGGDDHLTNTGTIHGDIDMGAGNDTVNLGVGSVVAGTIVGGAGNDTFNYAFGAGSVAISDDGNSGNTDTLNLTDVHFNDVILARDGSNLDVALSDGSHITILDQFDGGSHPGSGVENVTFGDGTSWTASQIDALTSLNVINATNKNATLHDTFGTDQINGGDKNDTIYSTSGYDQINAGAGNDKVIVTGAWSVTVHGGDGNDAIIANDGNGVFYGDAGNDTIVGGAGNSTLTGGAGNDTITGGAGNERIVGGAGNDQLTGGAGSDTFVFKAGDGKDTVSDFQASGASHDVIEVDASKFADFNAAMKAIHDADGNAVLDLGDGSTLTLDGVHKAALSASDFHFV